jgi:ABC-type glycerol-3-phosphate transport system substrate-binding protein
MSLKRLGVFALALLFCLTLGMGAFAADLSGNLTIWSFTDELQNMGKYFTKANPGVKINSDIIPSASEAYLNKVNQTLRSGSKGAPDVFTGEIAYVRQFIDAGYFEDLSVSPYLADAKTVDLMKYTVDLARDDKGHIRALSWQSTPGGIFYRRSLAKQSFGTDDPDKISALWSNMDGLIKMARTVKEQSGGKVKLVTDYGDLLQFPQNARKSKWIVDNKLVLEAPMVDFMDTAKLLRTEDLTAKVGQWSPPWFAGMADKSIFAYVLPTWGLHYVLKPNAEKDVFDAKAAGKAAKYSGDWGLSQGPSFYFWGGTWAGVNKKSPNKALAWEFVKFITLNADFLKAWAKETGDFLGNNKIVNEIAGTFSEEFLGGQNHYLVWQKFAGKINGGTVGPYDLQIQNAFNDQLDLFVTGKKSKDQAIIDFKKKVKSILPKVDVGL